LASSPDIHQNNGLLQAIHSGADAYAAFHYFIQSQ
jgi:hypothetical protein